jgi:DNA topoisomerase-6 subunit B
VNEMAYDFKAAEQLAKQQREISVAEFFEKNRHLLGFDNSAKALLLVVKEAVDNSLDACQDAGILPEISVKVKQLKEEDRLKVIIEDNGPGIVIAQIPKIFGKLLYGSKFFENRQNRGQQGIGISAAVLYSQLTTGKPTMVYSRISPHKPVHVLKLKIDTSKNEPRIIKRETYKNKFRDHGTRIEMEIEGKYRKGGRSVDRYMKETALANPFAKIIYKAPDGKRIAYQRITKQLPKKPKAIKPHPHGVEMGVFERMTKISKSRNIYTFLTKDFSRMGKKNAIAILKQARIKKTRKASSLSHSEAEKVWRVIQQTKLTKPPLGCLSPVGEEVLEKAIIKDFEVEFAAAVTRPPAVYRGNPFGIEVCMGYGGSLDPRKEAYIVRISNRVPLLYQASSGVIYKALKSIDWRSYRIEKKGKFPYGPLVVLVHMYSTWIPYTSESKEAIDPYDEILKEVKLALQDCGRKMRRYLSGRKRELEMKQRKSLFEKYIPEVAESLSKLTGTRKEKIQKDLEKMLKGNK